MDGGRPVREFIAEERISCARIRAMLAGVGAVKRWSCGSPGAIRPMRLALLLRRYIWRAQGARLAAVRQRLARLGGGQLEFRVVVDIDIGLPDPQQVVCVTRFRRRPSGRITAQIEWETDGVRTPISSPILLTPAASD